MIYYCIHIIRICKHFYIFGSMPTASIYTYKLYHFLAQNRCIYVFIWLSRTMSLFVRIVN